MKKKVVKDFAYVENTEYSLVYRYRECVVSAFETSVKLGILKEKDRPQFVLCQMDALLRSLGYRYDHTGTVRRYHGRLSIGMHDKYNGRFGFGYILMGFPTNSNGYSEILYYVKKK